MAMLQMLRRSSSSSSASAYGRLSRARVLAETVGYTYQPIPPRQRKRCFASPSGGDLELLRILKEEIEHEKKVDKASEVSLYPLCIMNMFPFSLFLSSFLYVRIPCNPQYSSGSFISLLAFYHYLP